MNDKSIVIVTPVGSVRICADSDGICAVSFVDAPPDTEPPRSGLLERAVKEISEYFGGERRTFDLPLSLSGTPFQLRVWRALRDIPFGQTRSYGEIARIIGAPKASRAVGAACGRNPIAVIVPCHRVIGADGSLIDFAAGVDVKKHLLDFERIGE